MSGIRREEADMAIRILRLHQLARAEVIESKALASKRDGHVMEVTLTSSSAAAQNASHS